jgi:hypothetical protein
MSPTLQNKLARLKLAQKTLLQTITLAFFSFVQQLKTAKTAFS